MLKPILRTTILAGVLFFLLVYLGMKYHWVDAFKKEDDQKMLAQKGRNKTDQTLSSKVELSDVPPITMSPDVSDGIVTDFVADAESNDGESPFLPEIIKNTAATSLIDSMTKDQIALYCQTLYYKSLDMVEDLNAEILIGNCVVSNYQEPFQETIKTQVVLQREQQLKLRASKNCRYDIQQPENASYTNIEKELLIGICVSDLMGK